MKMKSIIDSSFFLEEPTPEEFKAIRKRMGVSPDASYTYFAWGQRTELIKIGRSFRPHQRMRELGLSTAQTVDLIAAYRGDIEAIYHTAFSEHRRFGEWFAPHPDIISEIDFLNARERAEMP